MVLATNAYRPLLKRLRLMTVPVYDYALMSEPLTAQQRDSIGWVNGEGISDSANQFHYYRLTRDGRICGVATTRSLRLRHASAVGAACGHL